MKKLLIFLALGAIASAPLRADIFLNTGDNLQNALNSANCGEHIILQAGSSFSGNFVLPYKPGCSQFIEIKTNGAIPAEGTRISPVNASEMAKIVANTSYPAIEAEAQASYYKFTGIEITNVGGSVVTQELAVLGSRSSGGDIPFAQHPHHITFDRVWIHEATNDTTTPDSITTTAIRGMNINASDITIKDSRLAGFRTYTPVPNGVEASNCILFRFSALRVNVENNYLESWFVPIFFGGSGGETANAATLSSPTFNSSSHTGSAVFSSVSNLGVGDLVAMKVTGGVTPLTNPSHSGEPIQFQVAKVTGITGNTVNFQSWGSYDGAITGGNPLLQLPDAPGLAQWNGYLNEDIDIIRNDFVIRFNPTESVWTSTGGSPTTDPLSVQTNYGYAPKGFIEIKMARNLLIDGNTFDGWTTGLTVTSRNQGTYLTSGGFPWSGLFNVTVSNNWFKKTLNWFRNESFPIGGPLLQDNEMSNVRSGPFVFKNNLIESGVFNVLASMVSADNVTVSHNTYPGYGEVNGFGRSSLVFAHGAPSSGFVFRDNILPNNEYGMNCQIPPYILSACWPSLFQDHNVIIDNRSAGSKVSDPPLSTRYPADLIAATNAAVGWGLDYRLLSSSPFKGQASDGFDPGVDIDALLAAIGGGETEPPDPPDPPDPPADTQAPFLAVSVTPTGAKGIIAVADSTDNVGVVAVEFYIDGALRLTDSSAPYSYTTNLPGKKGSQHSLFVRAYDAAGNQTSMTLFVSR